MTSQRSRPSHPRRRSFPVTVDQLPVVRCSLCGRTLAYRPGQVTTVLTMHYQREHPSAMLPQR
jgi:hypothetical protein